MGWQNTETGSVKELPDVDAPPLFDQPGLVHAAHSKMEGGKA